MNGLLDKHNVVMFAVLGMLLMLTLWMQFVLVGDPEIESEKVASNDPDYYVEYFTSYGVDEEGKQYQLEADRLVHYPLDNKALLDKPHLTQTDKDGSPTHIYADSGWLFSDGTEILLTENVKVIRSQGQQLGGAATTNRMRIKLKP
ncbi:MAG: LPS export ABC transporter periplasmic protein LptC [Arenicellales bacterium]